MFFFRDIGRIYGKIAKMVSLPLEISPSPVSRRSHREVNPDDVRLIRHVLYSRLCLAKLSECHVLAEVSLFIHFFKNLNVKSEKVKKWHFFRKIIAFFLA